MITTHIAEAVQALQHHRIAAIPTETVYGLAGIALYEDAIRQIFSFKNRPLNHPLILHVANHFDLNQWVMDISDHAQTLIEQLWPGPLTLVFNCRPHAINTLVNGGQRTIAIRCPNHPVTIQLLTELNLPLVAPSANPFGKISPTTAAHVEQSFNDPNLLILDGGRCEIGIESTIVDVSNPAGYRVLRQGIISNTVLETLLPGKQLIDTPFSTIRVPGKLDTHYQPKKTLHCFSSVTLMQQFCSHHPDSYVLSFKKNHLFSAHAGISLAFEPERLAYDLYYELRLADASSASCIVIELPPDLPEWAGVRERLSKAGILH